MEVFGSIQCGACGTNVSLTSENAIAFIYEKPLYGGECPYQHLLVECVNPQCVCKIRYFCGTQDMEAAIQAGCSTAMAAYAEDAVIEGWYRANKLHPADQPEPGKKPITLTERLVKECIAFEEFLATAPDEWIYELIKDPAPKLDLPERWI